MMADKVQPSVKKVPVRRCVGCGEHLPKVELVRVLRTPEGEVTLDLTGKKSGRGAYICKNAECLRKARRKKSLESSLEISIPDDVYARLEGELGVGR